MKARDRDEPTEVAGSRGSSKYHTNLKSEMRNKAHNSGELQHIAFQVKTQKALKMTSIQSVAKVHAYSRDHKVSLQCINKGSAAHIYDIDSDLALLSRVAISASRRSIVAINMLASRAAGSLTCFRDTSFPFGFRGNSDIAASKLPSIP